MSTHISDLEEYISRSHFGNLFAQLNPTDGAIVGAPQSQRRLSDLRDCFADAAAYGAALEQGDPLIYTVSEVEPRQGEGQLHYAVAKLMPGRVGSEYHLTKGHVHAWRSAAELYIGLAGQGLMLLEDVRTDQTHIIPLIADGVVYVPGHTAHRTINIGEEPLTYLGVYPAQAGHDYTAIASRNFSKVVLDHKGQRVVMDRTDFLRSIEHP